MCIKKLMPAGLFAACLFASVWAFGQQNEKPETEEPIAIKGDAPDVVLRLQELFSQPIPKLARQADTLASEVLASLIYDRDIGECSAWEQLLQEARVELNELAAAAATERTDLKQKLQAELDDICDSHEDGPQRNRQMVLVIQAYRPMLAALKHQEEAYRLQIGETDAQLLSLRYQRLSLERLRRLKKQGLGSDRIARPALPNLPPSMIHSKLKADPTESLEQAKKSLEEF